MPAARAWMVKCDAEGCQRRPEMTVEWENHLMIPVGWTEEVPVIVTSANAPKAKPKFYCPDHSKKAQEDAT